MQFTATPENVTNFLRHEFDRFLDCSVSPEPNQGIFNYGRHLIGASDMISQWKCIIEIFPEHIRSYFREVQLSGDQFHSSVLSIAGSPLTEDCLEHHKALMQLPELYYKGLQLQLEQPDCRELNAVVTAVGRQLAVAICIFDSTKRNSDFQLLMWGDNNALDRFLDAFCKMEARNSGQLS